MERIIPKLLIWEQISEHFSTHSFFAPKWRKETIGRAQTCLGKFACISLSWILHYSNEGGQVTARLCKYKHIWGPFACCHRLLGYGSDLQEIVLAQSSSKGKMSKKCKVNWSDIDGASPKPKRLHLEKDETDSLYHCPIQGCDHDGFQSQRGCRKHVNTKHGWFHGMLT